MKFVIFVGVIFAFVASISASDSSKILFVDIETNEINPEPSVGIEVNEEASNSEAYPPRAWYWRPIKACI